MVQGCRHEPGALYLLCILPQLLFLLCLLCQAPLHASVTVLLQHTHEQALNTYNLVLDIQTQIDVHLCELATTSSAASTTI